ncbi:hypothetical protein [Coprobacter fastidiosus]
MGPNGSGKSTTNKIMFSISVCTIH